MCYHVSNPYIPVPVPEAIPGSETKKKATKKKAKKSSKKK